MHIYVLIFRLVISPVRGIVKSPVSQVGLEEAVQLLNVNSALLWDEPNLHLVFEH